MIEDKWNEKNIDSPSYSDMQRLLQKNQAAIVYFHISPYLITTFIVQSQQQYPSIVTCTPDQFQKFSEWIKQWKKDYTNYRNAKVEGQKSIWRVQLPKNLAKLAKILNITNIVSNLSIEHKQLIIIPHRDMQLIPLHYLFSLEKKDLKVTYLPSAKIGIRLTHSTAYSDQQMLIVENYDTEIKNKKFKKGQYSKNFRQNLSRLHYPTIEASLITQFYSPNCNHIPGLEATKNKVIEALKTAGNFAFTGHGYHDLENPKASSLIMKEGKISLEDILNFNLRNYFLVCLSSCESGITSSYRLLDDYVGLVSGFLAVGSTYVISTLWTVDDISSALLMIEFHRLIKEDSETPVSALKKAQNWLQNLTYDELSIHYSEIAKKMPRNKRKAKRYLNEEAQWVKNPENIKYKKTKYPFSDPYYWAGFTITGKVEL